MIKQILDLFEMHVYVCMCLCPVLRCMLCSLSPLINRVSGVVQVIVCALTMLDSVSCFSRIYFSILIRSWRYAIVQ